MYRYPEGFVDLVEQNYKEMNNRELCELVKEHYGVDFTLKQMNSLKKRKGFVGGPRVKVYTDIFPKEICEYIKENHPGVCYAEMADRLNKEFGTNYTTLQIRAHYKARKYHSGIDGRFYKGQQSHNKGKKLTPEQRKKLEPTMFKPGHKPKTQEEVGAEVITKDGYKKRKIAQPKEWEFVHRLVWMEHNGPIPKGMKISFRDGNRLNTDISNLFITTDSEHSEMNRLGLRSHVPELTDLGLKVAQLNLAAKKRRKG